MQQRTVIVAGIVAAAAVGGTLVALRGRSNKSSASRPVGVVGSNAEQPVTPGPGPKPRGAVSAPATPELAKGNPDDPAMPTLPGEANGSSGPVAPLFDTEVRDDQWAPAAERELQKRLASVKFDNVNVDSAACKTTTCQLVVSTNDSKSLGKMIGFLESPKGAYGWADHLLLGGPETADGRTTMKVTLLFEP